MKLEDLISHSHAEVRSYFEYSDRYSVYENYGDFQVFILRRMKVALQSLGFYSEAYLIKGDEVFFYNREKKDFFSVKSGFSGLLIDIESYYEQNQSIINSYASEIERLEDFLFSRSIPGYFMDLWFDIKKDLSKIENFYFRNSIVYREFMKKMDKQIGDLHDDYKDIEESIQFQSTHVITLKSRIESLHNYYDSIKNDKLNKTLLTLTIISGVFLPLNLIVGFFGMNTEGLYFHGDPSGTQNVMLILAVVLLIFLLGGKVVQMIDHYILRYILGRYNFYQNMSKRVSDLDQRLKGS